MKSIDAILIHADISIKLELIESKDVKKYEQQGDVIVGVLVEDSIMGRFPTEYFIRIPKKYVSSFPIIPALKSVRDTGR
jgi:hypothetical protein